MIEFLRAWWRKWLGIDTDAAAVRALAEAHAQLEKRVTLVNLNAQTIRCETEVLVAQLGAKFAFMPDRVAALNTGMDALHTKDSALEKLIAQSAQDLQQQITALNVQVIPILSVKASAAQQQGIEIMPGRVRFSERKRQFEADHRKPVETPTGKQIEENNRIIAAGERKSEETAG